MARQDRKANEAIFPHIVEIVVPTPSGAGLEEMYAFHGKRGIPSRSGRRHRLLGQHYVRWCFADLATADAFKAQFGGKLLTPPMPADDPVAAAEWAKKFIQDD